MVRLYYDLIRNGIWTLERVPLRWRAAVQEMLDADNVAENETESEG